jgi:hypothetical protein
MYTVHHGGDALGTSALDRAWPTGRGASGAFRPAPAFERLRAWLRPYGVATVYWTTDGRQRWLDPFGGGEMPPPPALAVRDAAGGALAAEDVRVVFPEDSRVLHRRDPELAGQYVLEVLYPADAARPTAPQLSPPAPAGPPAPCRRCGEPREADTTVYVTGYVPGMSILPLEADDYCPRCCREVFGREP